MADGNFRVKLIDNWKDVLKHAWSVHGLIALAMVNALFMAWPATIGILPVWIVFAGSMILSLLIVFLRLVEQKQLHE